jgi:hypothetical protein
VKEKRPNFTSNPAIQLGGTTSILWILLLQGNGGTDLKQRLRMTAYVKRMKSLEGNVTY